MKSKERQKVSMFPYLGQVQTGTVASVVVVAVHVEDLLAFDRQKTRENALGQTSAHNNDVVLLILLDCKVRNTMIPWVRHNNVQSVCWGGRQRACVCGWVRCCCCCCAVFVSPVVQVVSIVKEKSSCVRVVACVSPSLFWGESDDACYARAIHPPPHNVRKVKRRQHMLVWITHHGWLY